jgi:hypothetical protein
VADVPSDRGTLTMWYKKQIIIFINSTTLLFGCSDNSTSTTSEIKNDSLTKTSFDVDSTIEIKNGIAISESIISEIEKATSWKLQEGSLTIDTLAYLDDGAFYLIYEISSGVCLTKYIITFIDNKAIDFEEIEQGCDADLGSPRYQYSELRNSQKHTFKKVFFVQTPADKKTIDELGDFKEGYSQDNVQMRTDSTIILFSINIDATIKHDTLRQIK